MEGTFIQFMRSARYKVTISGVLLLLTVSLMACGHTVTLMPTPEALRDERIDFFAHNPNLEKNNKVTLFYATNRLSDKSDSGLKYLKKFDHTLRFGEATLQIGSEEVTWEQLHKESTTAGRTNTFEISLIRTEETGRLEESESPEMLPGHLAEFMEKLNDAISASPLKTLTIYVHGANSSFYRAAAQGAQYRYFTGKQAVVLLFAWPSAENILLYETGMKNNKKSVPDFIRLLRMMASYSSAKRIHIIGYSAGGRLSGDALGRLGREYELENPESIKKKFRFGQLYLTSSDEPLKQFIDNVPSYFHLFEGLTMTVDMKDTVLGFAQSTDGKIRMGRPPEDTRDLDLTDAQNEWITRAVNSNRLNIINLQINKIPGFEFSHGAWYSNPWVSTDVIMTLNLGLQPKVRGLDSYTHYHGRELWYFPPNYIERLTSSLVKLKK